MNHEHSESVLKKSIHGLWGYLTALLCTVLTGVTAAQAFTVESVSAWDMMPPVRTVLAILLLADSVILWCMVLARKKAATVIAALLQAFKLLLSGVCFGGLTAQCIGEAVYRAQNPLAVPPSRAPDQILGLFTQTGVICLAAGAALVTLFEGAALAFLLSVRKVYEGNADRISGRFLSILSLIGTVLAVLLIPVTVFFESIAQALGIDTDCFRLPEVSWDFASYSLQDGLTAAGLLLTPLVWLMLFLTTKRYADSNNSLYTAPDSTPAAQQHAYQPSDGNDYTVMQPSPSAYAPPSDDDDYTVMQPSPAAVNVPSAPPSDGDDVTVTQPLPAAYAPPYDGDDVTVAEPLPAAYAPPYDDDDVTVMEPSPAAVPPPSAYEAEARFARSTPVTPVYESFAAQVVRPTAGTPIAGTHLFDYGYSEADII